MATHSGKNGIVKVGGSPAIIGEMREWSIEESAVVHDSSSTNSAQGNGGWTTSKTGLKSWEGSLTCWLDYGDTNGQEVLDNGAEVALKFYPDDDDTGDQIYSGSAIVSNVVRKGGLEGEVEVTFSFKGTGALAASQVPA